MDPNTKRRARNAVLAAVALAGIAVAATGCRPYTAAGTARKAAVPAVQPVAQPAASAPSPAAPPAAPPTAEPTPTMEATPEEQPVGTPESGDPGIPAAPSNWDNVEPANYPDCTGDDGSGPVPCYWHADRQGNGHGADFYVDPSGGIVYPNGDAPEGAPLYAPGYGD